MDDSNTEENGSSAENDEQKVPLSRRSSRHSLSNKRPQLSLRADSSSSSSSDSSNQSTRRERRSREIAEPEKKDEQIDMLKKQVAERQKQLAELPEKDQTVTLTKRVAELEAQLTEAKSSTAIEPAFNIALPRSTTGATGQRPTELIPPRDGTCWGCGDPRHRHWACAKLSNAEKCRLYCRRIRRIAERSRPMCIVIRNSGNRHSNADGLSRRARPPAARHEEAVESASQSTNKEQLNAAYDTDTEQDEVMDSEQSELEEQIPSARPVHATKSLLRRRQNLR